MCSHLDTVPPGNIAKWTRTNKKPWKAAVKNGRVYGLGSADDKGPLLAMIYASSNIPLKALQRPLVIAGTFGEETGMGGARLFTRGWKYPKPLLALVAEPTGLGITYRHKGIGAIVLELKSGCRIPASPDLHRYDRKFVGRQAHSGRPHLGVNALVKAVRFLKSFSSKSRDSWLIQLEAGTAVNIIPDLASVSVLRFSGQTKKRKKTVKSPKVLFPLPPVVACLEALETVLTPLKKAKDTSFYPQTLTSNLTVARTQKNVLRLTFDFRLLPGQSVTSIHQQFARRVERIVTKTPQLRARLWIERNNPPLGLRLRDPLPQFCRSLLRANRLPAQLVTKPSCTEAGIYHAWGVPAVVIGPGHADSNIHSPNECISIRQIERAIDFYRYAISEICEKKGNVLNPRSKP